MCAEARQLQTERMQSPRPSRFSPTHSTAQQEGEGYGKEEADEGGGAKRRRGKKWEGERKGEWRKKGENAQVFSHTFPPQGHVFLYRNIKPVLLSVMDLKMLHPGCCDRFVYFNPHARCGVS